jgi:hypothetical protein
MATTSQVKSGLDDISAVIRNGRQAAAQVKARITALEAELGAVPTTFADLLATVNAYTPSDAFETLSKAELAKLTTEFVALKAAALTAKNALASITEF